MNFEKPPIELRTEVDQDYLVDSLVDSGINLVDFILALDQAMADWGFTINLIKGLIGTLVEDAKEDNKTIHDRIIENSFESKEFNKLLAKDLTWRASECSKSLENLEKVLSLIEEVAQ